MAVLPLQTNMSKTLFAQVGFLRILDMLFTIIWAFKRYQVYLGSIFFRVEPYVSWDAIKLECIGHIQKRMDNRFRHKVKEYEGKGEVEGKCNKLYANIVREVIRDNHGLLEYVRVTIETMFML